MPVAGGRVKMDLADLGTAQVLDESFIESNHDGIVRMRNRNVVRDSSGQLLRYDREIKSPREDVVLSSGRLTSEGKLVGPSALMPPVATFS